MIEYKGQAGNIMAKSVRQNIYEAVRDKITHGELHPGERLVEADLVREFKSSRSPVREALRLLESEGLITAENHKGIHVSKLSFKDIAEIYDLRCLLESYAAHLTALQVNKETVARLTELQHKLIKAAEKIDLEQWLTNNTLFHKCIDESCGNQNLISMIQTLKRRVYRYKYMVVRIPALLVTYSEQHDKIFQAIRKGNGKMAEKYMQQHLEFVKKALLRNLPKFPIL